MPYNHLLKSKTSQNVTSHNATCIDDKRSIPTALQVAQRNGNVVQRNLADGKFLYYGNLTGYKDRIPFFPGYICFSPYNDSEVRSANFNGCLMMAFQFNGNSQNHQNLINNQQIQGSTQLNLTTAPPTQIYIAHVAQGRVMSDDAKMPLVNAETENLINILAIFKPYRFDKDLPQKKKSKGNMGTNRFARTNRLTGGMQKNSKGKWIANVYYQEAYQYGHGLNEWRWKNKRSWTRSKNAKKLSRTTEATKAYLYAYTLDKSRDPTLKAAVISKLRQITDKKALKEALKLATTDVGTCNFIKLQQKGML